MSTPNIIVIGAGFAGVKCCQGLRNVPCNVVLFDKHNYHLFQPLLYQVATAGLSPAEIAFPIRQIFRRQKNVTSVLAAVEKIDLSRKVITVQGTEVDYDYLVLAAGATHSYFGHDEWNGNAPGLKSIEDALLIRKRVLLAYEEAEFELDDAARRSQLTFVIVGGGPTGVELAGALREIAAEDLSRDYRHIDTTTARIILIEANDRLIKTFPKELSERAYDDLKRMGVEIMLNSRVTAVDERGLNIGDERIECRNVFWAAGVQASPLSKALGVELDRAGRVKVNADLSIPGHPEVFVAGDLAAVTDAKTAQPVPGVAPAAMQMGSHIAKVLRQEIVDGVPVEKRQPFNYHDKGSLATIGKAHAVADLNGWKFKGVFAWLLWSVVHLMFLITFRSKVLVMINWISSYIFRNKGARLITGEFTPRIRSMRDVTPNS